MYYEFVRFLGIIWMPAERSGHKSWQKASRRPQMQFSRCTRLVFIGLTNNSDVPHLALPSLRSCNISKWCRLQPLQPSRGFMARKAAYRRRSPSYFVHPPCQQNVVIVITLCPMRNSPTRASVGIQSSLRLN